MGTKGKEHVGEKEATVEDFVGEQTVGSADEGKEEEFEETEVAQAEEYREDEVGKKSQIFVCNCRYNSGSTFFLSVASGYQPKQSTFTHRTSLRVSRMDLFTSKFKHVRQLT